MCNLLRKLEHSCVDCLKSIVGSHSRATVWLGLREERKKTGHSLLSLGLGEARDPVVLPAAQI